MYTSLLSYTVTPMNHSYNPKRTTLKKVKYYRGNSVFSFSFSFILSFDFSVSFDFHLFFHFFFALGHLLWDLLHKYSKANLQQKSSPLQSAQQLIWRMTLLNWLCSVPMLCETNTSLSSFLLWSLLYNASTPKVFGHPFWTQEAGNSMSFNRILPLVSSADFASLSFLSNHQMLKTSKTGNYLPKRGSQLRNTVKEIRLSEDLYRKGKINNTASSMSCTVTHTHIHIGQWSNTN